ncbi:MAG TPA: SDR family oxidoreductase [Burkholderiaceae bacterium]|jgi:uncharacterized protein YbjT (DUF2867 family)|nr:SDR family oxidoreductase [Burkholderiaceae bacterium]
MKVVIVGGSGLIGKKLAALLRKAGHDVTPASPSTGVNSVTGEGLDQALAGAQVVVDVTNSPSFETEAVMRFFRASTRNLMESEARAGVRHHVALSVVGTDRKPGNGYFEAKLAQEKLIESSGLPYTIVRATQFFEFIKGIADASTRRTQVHLSPALIQPIAGDDVAAALADAVAREPLNGVREIAGPEVYGLDDLARRFLQAIGDPREVVTDPEERYFGMRLTNESITPGDKPDIGRTSLQAWLQAQAR